MKQFILASGSPSRKELLERTGVSFTVEVSNYEEDMTLELSPLELVKHLSAGKAQDVASRHEDAVIILAADSIVAYDGQVLGKPYTTERANEMLRTLSGTVHSHITGFTILDTETKKHYSDAVETKIHFKNLSSAEIDNYLAKENVLNYAGAYIIQGLGNILVEKIEGSYSSVVGLPLAQVASILKDFGVELI